MLIDNNITFPVKRHYAVIQFKKISVGNPRDSRMDYTENACKYLAFGDIEELKDWIKNHPGEFFKVVDVTPIAWDIKIELNPEKDKTNDKEIQKF